MHIDDVIPGGAVVRFGTVTKTYVGPGGARTVAVNELDLQVRDGEVLGLLGPNGAGKTTTIEMMVGLRRPTSGTVTVLGLDPHRDRDALRTLVSVQPQHAALFENQTVLELLRTWSTFYPQPDDVDSVIERLGLQDSRGVRTRALSGGQRQRLLVGLALVARPRLLVLDEPSTGMDPNARQELWAAVDQLRTEGRTVVLSTHSMEEAQQLGDRIAIMNHGHLVACDTPARLIARHAPLREITFVAPADLDLSALTVLPGVASCESHDSSAGVRVRLRTDDSDAVLAMLPSLCRPRDLQMHDAGLEGVFRRLTADEDVIGDRQVMPS